MTRAEMVNYIQSALHLNRYQARTMTRELGDFYVLRATYPGGAPNPIIGAERTWGTTTWDERWRVSLHGSDYMITRVDERPDEILGGPKLVCGCPADSGCTGRHPGALGSASGYDER